jgi:hypothetical protein
LERFGKAFGAGSVAHARRVGVVASATGPWSMCLVTAA